MAKNTKDDIGVLYKSLTLGPELRSEEPKGKYPKGNIKKVFEIFSAEMTGLMRVTAWCLLFLLPLLVVIYWYSSYATSKAIFGFNFMGNIGMAYPGGSDNVTDGIIALYHAYQNVLYIILPAMVVASIGVCGAFNCYKSFMWGEKVEKVTKVFFRGVKLHWWKYLIVVTFDALVVLATGSMLLWFLELRALSMATAGHWVLLIFVFIVAFLIMYLNMHILPLLSEVDVPFFKNLKNACIFSIKMAVFGIPLFIILILPLGLFFVKNSFITVLLFVLLLMFGFTFYGLSFTGFSQYALDNVYTPLYMMSVSPKNENKKAKKNKKNTQQKQNNNAIKDNTQQKQNKDNALKQENDNKNNVSNVVEEKPVDEKQPLTNDNKNDSVVNDNSVTVTAYKKKNKNNSNNKKGRK